MKAFLSSVVLVLSLCISVGRSIKCYQCYSSQSWDDCVPDNNTDCSPGLDGCYKVHVTVEVKGKTGKSFLKGCIDKSVCNADGCKTVVPFLNVKVTECEIKCCHSDLCNGAKVPMVSSLLFLTCAIAAFLRLKE